jgi:hypothetical protein
MNNQFHTLKLIGLYLNEHNILLRIKIGFDMNSNCLVNIQGVSEVQGLVEELINI